MNEDAPVNNISSGNIADPKNKMLGGTRSQYQKTNDRRTQLLKRWLEARK